MTWFVEIGRLQGNPVVSNSAEKIFLVFNLFITDSYAVTVIHDSPDIRLHDISWEC